MSYINFFSINYAIKQTNKHLLYNLSLNKSAKKKFINLNTIFVFYGVIYEK